MKKWRKWIVAVLSILFLLILGVGIGLYWHNNKVETAFHNQIEVLETSINEKDLLEISQVYDEMRLLEEKRVGRNSSNRTETIFLDNGRQLVDGYATGDLTFKQLDSYLIFLQKKGLDESVLKGYRKESELLKNSKEAMDKGKLSYEDGKYMEALEAYQQVIPEDQQNYSQLDQSRLLIWNHFKDEADTMASHYMYEEAIIHMNQLKSFFAEEVKATVLEYEAEKKELVIYEGPVRHVFFHSLIVYPELAFDGDGMSNGYNYWMTTVSEFNKMLTHLYERNFVLVNVNELMEKKVVDGKEKMVPKPLLLPPEKKPLIISIDDVNYYNYMKNDGFADRVVLDEKGEIACLVRTPDEEVIVGDYDVMPILDEFVKTHPDFSHRGAKGIIALTGYEGTLGYRTHRLDGDNYEEQREEVLMVIKRLKETGWLFASHSYCHWKPLELSKATLDYDTKKWMDEVASLIGDTNIYIYPFGDNYEPGDARLDYLTQQGFNVFCGVGPSKNMWFTGEIVLMDRLNLDGFMMHFGKQRLTDFFNVEEVMDLTRPEFN